MRKDRLLNVARALRESKNPEDFDMGMYGHACGTPACALGHYAAREDLQHTFTLDAVNDSILVGEDWVGFDSRDVRDHFGITPSEALELFEAEGCAGAKTAIEAAEFIERVVAEREAESC